MRYLGSKETLGGGRVGKLGLCCVFLRNKQVFKADIFSYRTKKCFLSHPKGQNPCNPNQHGLFYASLLKCFRIAFVHNLYNASSLEKKSYFLYIEQSKNIACHFYSKQIEIDKSRTVINQNKSFSQQLSIHTLLQSTGRTGPRGQIAKLKPDLKQCTVTVQASSPSNTESSWRERESKPNIYSQAQSIY